MRNSDASAWELDDVEDREELRQRYYGLMQEIRVLLPGVQILVAFLLTAPFASGFVQLPHNERVIYAIALGSGVASVVAFVTPIVIHRGGRRTARSQRLGWSIRLVRVALCLFAVTLTASLSVVLTTVFSGSAVVWISASVTGIGLAVAWLVVPSLILRSQRPAVLHADEEGVSVGDA